MFVIDSLTVKNNLKRLIKNVPDVVGKALYEESKIEMKEAKNRTPVGKTGNLKKSGTVYPPKYSGNSITCDMTFGSSEAYYAIYVHEDLEAFHPIGQAKFLESVILESAPHMSQRVGQRIFNDRLGL